MNLHFFPTRQWSVQSLFIVNPDVIPPSPYAFFLIYSSMEENQDTETGFSAAIRQIGFWNPTETAAPLKHLEMCTNICCVPGDEKSYYADL